MYVTSIETEKQWPCFSSRKVRQSSEDELVFQANSFHQCADPVSWSKAAVFGNVDAIMALLSHYTFTQLVIMNMSSALRKTERNGQQSDSESLLPWCQRRE